MPTAGTGTAAGAGAGAGDTSEPTITLLRHGHAWNNMVPGFPCRDPILTERGQRQAAQVRLSCAPDLVVVSPLTRALQTAIAAFGLDRPPPAPAGAAAAAAAVVVPAVQVWPDLRECGDRPFNVCRPRAQLAARYPFLDFGACAAHGVYGADTRRAGRARARRVRRRLAALSGGGGGGFRHIVVVSHQGFLRRLGGGLLRGFRNCECWSYRVGVDFSVAADGELAPPRDGARGPTQVAAGEQPEVDEAVEEGA